MVLPWLPARGWQQAQKWGLVEQKVCRQEERPGREHEMRDKQWKTTQKKGQWDKNTKGTVQDFSGLD